MGIHMYGTYDELVIELRGLDLLRAGRREVRVAVDDVWQVRGADDRALVSWDGERVLRLGARGQKRVLVLDLAPGAALDRIVIGLDDADPAAAELRRWGVGRVAEAGVPRMTALSAS